MERRECCHQAFYVRRDAGVAGVIDVQVIHDSDTAMERSGGTADNDKIHAGIAQ